MAGHPIRVSAELRLSAGEACPELRVKIGRNIQAIKLPPAIHQPDNPNISFEFTSGAGFKVAKIQAHAPDGSWKTLATRWIWAKPKMLSPVARPLEISPITHTSEKLILPIPTEPITVSIIIPVYNQWSHTCACIQSILKSEPILNYEIILADDKSTDETSSAHEFIENLIISRSPRNLGFLLNCNLAASKARGKFLYFLNNDTQIQPNAISALIDVFQLRPDAGIVGSKLIYPDGRLQEAGGIMWNDASAWNFGHRQDPSLPEFNYLKESDYCSGASLLISHDIWTAVGGFSDEFAPAYCEDSDLAYKIRAQGLKVYYQPKSVVVHFEGVSCGTDTGSGIKSYQVSNSKRFWKKWKTTLAAEAFPNAHNVFQARDRSRLKKLIVVIDHYIPKPDRDAGSRTMFQFLQMLAACDLNIKFLGANFYYDPEYADNLQSLGIEILAGVHYRDNWEAWFAENGPRIHAVLFSRPHITEIFLPVVKKYCPSALCLYYGHDLHFLREQREHTITGNSDSLRKSQDWLEREGAIFSKIDINLTPSHEEAALVKERWPHTKNRVVPAWFWRDWPGDLTAYTKRQGFLFVGGFGHPPNTDGLLWLLTEIWPAIRASLPDAVLHVVGSSAPPEISARTDPGLILHGFLSDAALADIYQNTRVALIPLRFGAGVKGKTVEAMRLGLPITTTTIGVEGLQDLPPEVDPTDSAVDFASKAILLHRDASAWIRQQAAQTTFVQEHFSWEKASAVFREAFDLPS